VQARSGTRTAPKQLFRVYVDESGDRGMGLSSSPYFVLAAVIVPDHRDAELRSVRDTLCKDLGKPTGTVLHFAENIKKHDQRKHVARLLGELDYVRVSFVIVDKLGLRSAGSLPDHTRMYNYAVRRLLERTSWYIDDAGGEAIVTFAHIRRFPYATLTSYLAMLRTRQTQIRWRALRGDPRIDQQGKVELLQVADIVAGCLGAAITADRFGAYEPAYLERLRSLIYTRPPGRITSYGMNIVGDSSAPHSFTDRLPWWSTVFPDEA
jgi:hypothetical protein